MSLTVKVDMSTLDAALDAARDQARNAIHPAAQAGAQVLYEAVLRNVDAIGTKSGNLRRSIYQYYDRDNSTYGKNTIFHVSWRYKQAPHGHLLEYGYVKKYVSYVGRDGKWYTAMKRGTTGAYFAGEKFKDGKGRWVGRDTSKKMGKQWASIKGEPIPLPGGPVQVAARAFIRSAQSYAPQAEQAMRERFYKELAK